MSVWGTTGNLSKAVKITKVADYAAANTTDVNATRVDMAGYESVVFLASIGTAAANNGVKVQQDTATGMGSAADLEDSQLLSDGTQTEFVVEVYRPRERYVRLVVERGTSTTVEAVWAIQYGTRVLPIDNETAAQAYELNIEPDEGTA